MLTSKRLMEKKLLKLLLKHQFYNDNKFRTVERFFPDALGSVYKSIVEAHAKYGRDITLDELEALYRANNPTATRATRQQVIEAIQEIQEVGDVGEDIASDVFAHMWRAEVGRQIAEVGLDIADGKEASLQKVVSIIERTQESFLPADEVLPITTDIDELLTLDDTRARWAFNIPSLADAVPGLAPGEFAIALARPEAGKTALGISLAAAPGGWCHQGANVHYIGNEEPVIRSMKRAIESCTGMTWKDVKENPTTAKRLFDPIRDKLTMLDDVDMSIEKLDLYCRRNRPDILIIDQLDKLAMGGQYSRSDEYLQELYIQARRIAKRHNLGLWGVTQASAEAEGKTRVTYAMAANSKTGKAAEADLVIGVGKAPINEGGSDDDPTRFLTLSKNKITGNHSTVVCVLDKYISRYEA